MATATIEERLAVLEAKVAQLAGEMDEAPTPQPATAWWKRLVGIYKDDPEFDEAERLGREWREASRPDSDTSDE